MASEYNVILKETQIVFIFDIYYVSEHKNDMVIIGSKRWKKIDFIGGLSHSKPSQKAPAC